MKEQDEYTKKVELALKSKNYINWAEVALTGIKRAKKNGQDKLVVTSINLLEAAVSGLKKEHNLLKHDSDIYCSFCGKNKNEVQKLIAGNKVFICNECSELVSKIIKEDNKL